MLLSIPRPGPEERCMANVEMPEAAAQPAFFSTSWTRFQAAARPDNAGQHPCCWFTIGMDSLAIRQFIAQRIDGHELSSCHQQVCLSLRDYNSAGNLVHLAWGKEKGEGGKYGKQRDAEGSCACLVEAKADCRGGHIADVILKVQPAGGAGQVGHQLPDAGWPITPRVLHVLQPRPHPLHAPASSCEPPSSQHILPTSHPQNESQSSRIA